MSSSTERGYLFGTKLPLRRTGIIFRPKIGHNFSTKMAQAMIEMNQELIKDGAYQDGAYLAAKAYLVAKGFDVASKDGTRALQEMAQEVRETGVSPCETLVARVAASLSSLGKRDRETTQVVFRMVSVLQRKRATEEGAAKKKAKNLLNQTRFLNRALVVIGGVNILVEKAERTVTEGAACDIARDSKRVDVVLSKLAHYYKVLKPEQFPDCKRTVETLGGHIMVLRKLKLKLEEKQADMMPALPAIPEDERMEVGGGL